MRVPENFLQVIQNNLTGMGDFLLVNCQCFLLSFCQLLGTFRFQKFLTSLIGGEGSFGFAE
ncbi:hypothetical protein Mal48_21890 [Thalassoglobus polymorphus]|uniref:Uncharacterized protein n=1 Tax=Thalassoglobus polymorphus TaxID=2527994 RepID=A0A517QMR3_9PLAN|nr:hypothetical protein Mal48_21890 [Thalassoglobus polymorphus]